MNAARVIALQQWSLLITVINRLSQIRTTHRRV
jgi:hypothetical protein